VKHLTRGQRRDLLLSLGIVPGRGRQSSPEEVLRQFGTTDGPALSLNCCKTSSTGMTEPTPRWDSSSASPAGSPGTTLNHYWNCPLHAGTKGMRTS
jgi:hypothetical protein